MKITMPKGDAALSGRKPVLQAIIPPNVVVVADTSDDANPDMVPWGSKAMVLKFDMIKVNVTSMHADRM